MSESEFADSLVLLTKTGDKQLKDIIENDLVLCSDNTYHKVLYINKCESQKLLSVKGFWFNRFLIGETSKLLVCKRDSVSIKNASLCFASDLILNEKYREYYIGILASYYGGKIDDGVYDNDWIWVPFVITTTESYEVTYRLEIDGSELFIANRCILHT